MDLKNYITTIKWRQQMNSLECKMVDILKDLKENHNVLGIKAEFEAEGTRLEEALRLKDVVSRVGLDLTIKIGGCEAIKDMYDAKLIGVDSIVAPMIETPYAMQKFCQAHKKVFCDEKNVRFFINLETITGFNNLEAILKSPYFQDIDGCTLGRTDMAGSMNLGRDDVNNNEIFEIASSIALKMQKAGKMMIIGGGLSASSLPFFEKLPFLSKFETRKVIFDAQKALKKDAEKSILKAFEFEFMWLKNKQNFYNAILQEDAKRIELLESRVKHK